MKSGEEYSLLFPADVQTRWVRFVSSENTTASAWFDYK
jgi:hypothetical protein